MRARAVQNAASWPRQRAFAASVCFVLGVGAPTYVGGCGDDACSDDAALELYERRIEPILSDERPASCNQCHLSGVDLSMYVQSTPCQTMACMIDEGIVNLDSPADSLVLSWIDRAEPGSEGITDEIVKEERDAMLEWIEFSAECHSDTCGNIPSPCGGPPDDTCTDDEVPFDDPGGCDDKTMEELFLYRVYKHRGRCYPCHFNDGVGPAAEGAPNWIVEGDCGPASLETMRNALAGGYFDEGGAMSSLLLLKPLEEDLGGVEHGGTPKIHETTEEAYIDFVYFLDRWAECQTGEAMPDG